ncbi:MAG: hypothetical protein JNN30_07120 [Rhodanobacteraceae bacterium]|nr:hypothetical protein [Rhodanobacteraceae bacterium]
MTDIRKIFLASSDELRADRDAFEIAINRKNKEWIKRGVFLELVRWEDFLDAMAETRLQDKYNRAVRECDVFVMLFWTKVGKYSAEEFETAFRQFQATTRPFVFTYFKTAAPTSSPSAADQESLRAFQEKLKALGHFQTEYPDTKGLSQHFCGQLDKLVDNGFVEFEPDQADAAPAKGDSYQATVIGSGAVAQGRGAKAAGAKGIVIGNNTGSINIGTGSKPARRGPRK